MGGDQIQRITIPPFLLLVLRAVAEGTAGVGAVLVEVAVDLGLDDGRAVPRPHMSSRLLHGQVDGERIIPSTFHAGIAKAVPRRESRVSLVDSATAVETA